jgi:RNase P/RNase MRP subunit p29
MAVSSTTGGLRTGVCLSTDRPQNPYNGQVIYETDTNRTLVWDNSAWVVVADPALVSFSGTGATVTADAMTVAGNNVTPYTGRKNYVYNGSFQVAQRGTSVSASSGYTLDRWRIEPVNEAYSAGISGTIQQVDDAGYAMSVRSGSTAPGFYMIEQRFEGRDVAHLSGKTVTFSFRVKRVSTSVTQGTIRVNHDDDLSGSLRDEATIATVESNVSSISTSAYEQYSTSYTFPATVSTTGYYRIGIYFHGMGGVATSSEMFRIKDVQLEEGGVATPFECRSYADELMSCQRYYQIGDIIPGTSGAGYFQTNGSNNFGQVNSVQFHAQMRTLPTLTVAFNNVDNATITSYLVTKSGVGLRVIAANTGYQYFSYYASFTASAEI